MDNMNLTQCLKVGLVACGLMLPVAISPTSNATPATTPAPLVPKLNWQPCNDTCSPGTQAELATLHYRQEAVFAFKRAGAVGPNTSWGDLACATWPARSADRYTGPWNRSTANPILVIGNTYDPSTPYKGAVAMALELARARLLTVDGYGHTVFLNPSQCANRYITNYFIKGQLPPKGTTCKQDYQPFSPS